MNKSEGINYSSMWEMVIMVEQLVVGLLDLDDILIETEIKEYKWQIINILWDIQTLSKIKWVDLTNDDIVKISSWFISKISEILWKEIDFSYYDTCDKKTSWVMGDWFILELYLSVKKTELN